MKKVIFSMLLIAFSTSAIVAQAGKKAKNAVMVPAKFTAIDENKSEAAQTAYAVSRSILEGDWEKLDGLLDKDFTYTGDGSVYLKTNT